MEAALNSPYGRVPLGPAILAIGRSPDNQLVVNDPQASSHHAQIGPDAQGYLLTDIGSTNGTFVNEQRLVPHSPRLLNAGDVIRVGTTNFTYEITGVLQAGQTVAAPDQYGYQPTVAAPLSSFDEYNQAPPQGYPQQAAYPAYPQQGYPQQPPNYQGYPPPPQQPYMPQAGQVGFPPAQLQRKNRLGLWIGLAVVIVILVAAGVGGYVYLNRSTPQKTLQTLCDALKSGDYQTAYNQLSSHAQSQITEQRFASELQVAFGLLGGLKDCTVNNVTQNGSTATGSITYTFNDGKTIPGSGPLIDENGVWKLDTTNTQ